MKKAIGAMFLITASGCAADQVHFEERATLASRTSSLVLYDDGDLGQGSMNEQTCQFDALNGFIIADYDLPTTDERVDDVRGTVVVAHSAEGIHVLDENGWDQANDIALPGVLRVKMTETGVASLVNDDAGCRLDWRNDDTQRSRDLDESVCLGADGFVVDRVTGQAWVAWGDDVTVVTESTTTALGVPGDLLAFDEVTGNVAIASRGGSTVTGVDASGMILWSDSVRGGIASLTDFGARGAMAFAVEHDNGTAAIEAVDAESGVKIADYAMPEVADIVVSADASTLGLRLDDEVHFYDVFEGSEPVVFNQVQTQPPQMFAD